jgi:hypothetical protein
MPKNQTASNNGEENRKSSEIALGPGKEWGGIQGRGTREERCCLTAAHCYLLKE